MIAELVTYQLPPSMTREEAIAAARATVEKWQSNPDLIRKHFLLEPGNRTSGFYLWTSREAAERAHDEMFRRGVRERFTLALPVEQCRDVAEAARSQWGEGRVG